MINKVEDIFLASHNTDLPDLIIAVLTKDYPYGFSFDATCVRLLSEKTGMDVDINLQNTLKSTMFCRNDNVYFLPDVICSTKIRQEMIDISQNWIFDYGCFEISELYSLFANNVNKNAIDNLDDFETLYQFIDRSEIRCVASYGTRIARVNKKSIRDLFFDITAKILFITNDEYGGTINEDDLHDRFPAFSVKLLSNMIKEHAKELIKTEINEIICYQTLDALGLSEGFSDTLTEVLYQIDEIGLIPNETVLHTALSIRLGVNFVAEYNIMDDKIFRRLIAAYYKETTKRKWKRGVFAEVQN